MKAQDVIELMQLEPLPGEGGYVRRTYESKQKVPYQNEPHPVVSAIYYLITADNFSAFHLLERDEIFHFYAGDAIDFVQIKNDQAETVVFGNDIAGGEVPQIVVEGGTWQALRISPRAKTQHGWALVGTTVSPAFVPADHAIADRDALLRKFPALAKTIERFTRHPNLDSK
ncbi:MAG TPA: cupin domain-containing protein [Bdellovibrionota bacterium]|jgi:predicted cupin superfamily sugar epimerase|nr:cupin domain-containing protein [Bdellovibrionota bacterium]